jgi:hypothetical protein
MKLHGNAALRLNGRRQLVWMVLEQGRSTAAACRGGRRARAALLEMGRPEAKPSSSPTKADSSSANKARSQPFAFHPPGFGR